MSGTRGGYTGRFLRVDLDAQVVRVEETPDPQKWLGPRGWNAWIGWNEVPSRHRPVRPCESHRVLCGPAGGHRGAHGGADDHLLHLSTGLSAADRGRRPTWADTWARNSSTPAMTASSSRVQPPAPCYLLIEDDRVTIEDAGDLWGKGVYATQQHLKARHTAQHQIAAIGPAGENRVRFASILHRLSNAAGNGGFGGVMGAKNLKAIAVRGTGGVPIADPEGFCGGRFLRLEPGQGRHRQRGAAGSRLPGRRLLARLFRALRDAYRALLPASTRPARRSACSSA